jgi:exocyst complex component 4
MHEYECNKFGSSDLISDRKAINSLCILCTSMRWLANKVVQLRHIEDPGNFSRNDGGSSGRLRRRWTLIDAVGARSDECKPVYLPMTAETVGLELLVVPAFLYWLIDFLKIAPLTEL